VQGPEILLAVRVFDHYGVSMFHGPAALMQLKVSENEAAPAVSLAGPWCYQVEVKLDPAAICGPGGNGPTMPLGPDSQNAPSRLFNAMIHPLIPYAIRGAIWYQGESNASRAYQYRALMPALIEDWRQWWDQGDFPFYMVQLANFKERKPEPAESEWAELREAQTLTLRLKNTGMACIIDIGDAWDIHPRNKQDVGKRLALWALAKDYGRQRVYSGPMYRAMERQGDALCVSFDHVGGGLVAHGETLNGFAIAGADKQFVWAQAVIQGDTVIVRSDAVPEPVALRYGWADNPDCNLYNKQGLPAVPFRTDEWPGLTHGRK
jgi:sialate O-acetylesterase